MIVIAGPNGSGKTSVTQKFLYHKWAEGTLYINPDEVAQEIFGDWNSTESVIKAARYCRELREECLRSHRSFVFETVMSAEDKVSAQNKQASSCVYSLFPPHILPSMRHALQGE